MVHHFKLIPCQFLLTTSVGGEGGSAGELADVERGADGEKV